MSLDIRLFLFHCRYYIKKDLAIFLLKLSEVTERYVMFLGMNFIYIDMREVNIEMK